MIIGFPWRCGRCGHRYWFKKSCAPCADALFYARLAMGISDAFKAFVRFTEAHAEEVEATYQPPRWN
jgi:hypothetical protein